MIPIYLYLILGVLLLVIHAEYISRKISEIFTTDSIKLSSRRFNNLVDVLPFIAAALQFYYGYEALYKAYKPSNVRIAAALIFGPFVVISFILGRIEFGLLLKRRLEGELLDVVYDRIMEFRKKLGITFDESVTVITLLEVSIAAKEFLLGKDLAIRGVYTMILSRLGRRFENTSYVATETILYIFKRRMLIDKINRLLTMRPYKLSARALKADYRNALDMLESVGAKRRR